MPTLMTCRSIYGHATPDGSFELMAKMSVCVECVEAWMASNRLRLNPAKTELIWLGSSRRLETCTADSMYLLRRSGVTIQLSTQLRDLGVIADMTMICHLRQTSVTWQVYVFSTCVTCALLDVHWQLMLYMHLTVHWFTAALITVTDYSPDYRTISWQGCSLPGWSDQVPSRAPVSVAMHDVLYWLSFHHRVTFKLSNWLKVPPRFGTWISLAMLRSTRCRPWTITAPFRRWTTLASAIVPRTSTVTRAFYSSGAASWNSLPTALRHFDLTLSVFKRQLKVLFTLI